MKKYIYLKDLAVAIERMIVKEGNLPVAHLDYKKLLNKEQQSGSFGIIITEISGEKIATIMSSENISEYKP